MFIVSMILNLVANKLNYGRFESKNSTDRLLGLGINPDRRV